MKPQRSIRMPLRRPPSARPTSGTRKPKAAPRIRARAAAADDEDEIEDYEVEAEPNMRFSHALFVVLILHVIAVGGVIAFNSIKSGQTKTSVAASGATTPKTEGETPKAGGKASSPVVKTHTVAEGDTLTRIAATHGTSIEALERANGLTAYSTLRIGQVLEIPEPGHVPVTPSAQNKAAVTKVTSKPIVSVPKTTQPSADTAAKEKFLATRAQSAAPVKAAQALPAVAAEPAAPAPRAAAAPSEEASGTYTVAKGDNPYSIAKKHGVSYKKLLEINNIEDPTKIQIGQVLKMPPATN
ncbi:MAG: hypothetical protein Fur0032_03170 [Terrimicrobiaceae bacterium]